jgi:hypothetical protein
MMNLDPTQIVALAAALGWASGIRLYLVLFLVGFVDRMGWVAMPHGLHLLSHPLVLAASGLMVIVEFFADKVPWVDSIWDTVHTFIRVPAGAMLAASAIGALDPHGGTIGALVTKSSTRALANTSPEPFSNIGLSLGEDLIVPGGLALALLHPIVFVVLLAVMLALGIWLVPKIWRFLKRLVGYTPSHPAMKARNRGSVTAVTAAPAPR